MIENIKYSNFFNHLLHSLVKLPSSNVICPSAFFFQSIVQVVVQKTDLLVAYQMGADDRESFSPSSLTRSLGMVCKWVL